ncbi:MAG: exodeoxyribonuclease V subunit gamma [Opitutales bacterium]
MGLKGIFWHASNRQERLVEVLAERLRSEPRPDPLQGETILVPNGGLGRWLTHTLAEHLGVVFNVRLPFPGVFFGALTSAVTERAAPEDARFFWAVHAALAQAENWGGAETIHPEMEPLVRVQTAARLSQTLDAYSLYRPDWVERWEQGDAPHWQARLWRYLTEREETWTLGTALRALLKTRIEGLPASALPARLWVYGVPTLPPLMMDALGWLSPRVPVELFLLEPSPDFLGDLPGRRGAELEMSLGTSQLLPALGRLNRDRTNLLLDRNGVGGVEAFEEPRPATLLGALQASVYQPLGEATGAPHSMEDDASVQVHASHSPFREVEALRDTLLHCFEQMEALDPREVLIVTPELDTYLPLLEAIFQRGEPESWIPLSTAKGPGERSEGIWSRALSRLLDVAESRLEVETVYALIEETVVLEAQGWTAETLERIRFWIQTANISWGRDGADRARLGLPTDEANTWRFGIERLLLGVALDPDEGLAVFDRLPVDGVRGQDALLLGRWLEWVEALFDWCAQGEVQRAGAVWAEWLRNGVDRFLGGWHSAQSSEARVWQKALAQLEAGGALSTPVDLASLRYLLNRWAQTTPAAFFRGGVNVATPSQAQGVPARVVVCLGFASGAFPRADAPDASDVRKGRREGEPTLRDIDRQAFLEIVLCARERLILSYPGLAANADGEAPPSSVVEELLTALPLTQAARAGFVRRHPLVAHDPAYFQKGRLFTYDRVAARLASPAPPSQGEPLTEEGHVLSNVAVSPSLTSLESLVQFWRDPAGTFLKDQLGVRLPRPQELLSAQTAPEDSRLEDFQVRRRLLESLEAGASVDHALTTLAASGELPAGDFGRIHAQRLAAGAIQVRRRLKEAAGTHLPVALPIETGGEIPVNGQAYPIFGDILIRSRPGKVREADQLELWLRLLAAVASGHSIRGATQIGTDGQLSFRAPSLETARRVLHSALEGYAQGQSRPIGFSARCGCLYVDRIHKEDTPDDAWAKVEKEWRGNPFQPELAESRRPAHRICFGEAIPDRDTFVHWAERIIEPMRQHEEPTLHD